MTTPEQRRSLKARRMLRHAQLYVTADQVFAYEELAVAIGKVNGARRNLNIGAQGIIRGRIVNHWCKDCDKYRAAGDEIMDAAGAS
jgi:hypothetical protein